MDDKMIDAVNNWLKAIMPDVVRTLVEILTEDKLYDLGKEQGVHGPYTINLERLRAPITAIKFYTIVVEDGMMLAASPTIRNASEDDTSQLSFDMFFPISDFAASIADDEHIQQLVDCLLEQYKNAKA